MKSTRPRRRPHKRVKKTARAKSARKGTRKVAKKSVRAKRAPAPRVAPRPAAAPAAALAIGDLGLVEYAKSGAQKLRDKYPNLVFTSGLRDVQQQADAMAGNVVRNRKWIEQTYRATAQRTALQKWVDDHPQATTKPTISAGLKGVMDGWTDAQKRGFSRHMAGLAFDVQPVSQDADKIKTFIRALPHRHKFFDHEGGLTIWHVDFDKA